jgi:hypothetical protein
MHRNLSPADDLDAIVTPFPERLGSTFKLPYRAVWMMIFSGLLSARLFTIFSNNEPWITAVPSAGFAFLPCALGMLIVFYSKLIEQFTPTMCQFLNRPRDQAREWFETQIRRVFNDKWMISSGVALTAVFIPVVMQGGFYPEAQTSRIAFLVNMGAMSFMGGAMLAVMGGITSMIWCIGHCGMLTIQLFPHPHASIKSIGTLLGKISTSLMAVYFTTVLSMIPVTIDVVTMAVTTLFAGIVILFFIIPQIKIHRIMVENKYNKVAMLSGLVEEALDKVKGEPSQDNIRQIQQLFDIHRSLNEVDEWPFNHKLFLSVLGSVIVPLVVCGVTFYTK